MDAEAAPPPEHLPQPTHRPVLHRALRWAAVGIAALVLIAAALVVWVNSGPGRDYVARQISGL